MKVMTEFRKEVFKDYKMRWANKGKIILGKNRVRKLQKCEHHELKYFKALAYDLMPKGSKRILDDIMDAKRPKVRAVPAITADEYERAFGVPEARVEIPLPLKPEPEAPKPVKSVTMDIALATLKSIAEDGNPKAKLAIDLIARLGND